MKTFVVFALLAFVLGSMNAEESRIAIQWDKKVIASKFDTLPKAGQVAVNNLLCTYTITLANNSFADAPAMQVKYNVFVERQRPGDKGSTQRIEVVKGSKSVDGIKSHQKASVDTDAFPLNDGKLSAGWHYVGGGRTVAKDSIKGVWVRVYQDGKVVAEHVNPSTLSSKEKWKD